MRVFGQSARDRGVSGRWCLVPLAVYLCAPIGGGGYAGGFVVVAALLFAAWVILQFRSAR